MKKCVLILMVAGIATGSCKKRTGPPDVQPAQPDTSLAAQITMSAVINAEPWKTDSSYSYKILNSGNDSNSYNVLIQAIRVANGEVSTIKLNITDFKGKGTYPVNPPVTTATYYNGNNRHYALTGNINITADTGRLLSGTFNFTADNGTITVLDGQFKVALP